MLAPISDKALTKMLKIQQLAGFLSLSWTAPQTGRTGAEMHSCETGGDTALCEKKGVILDKFDAILNRLGGMELSMKIENGQVRAHECWSLCLLCLCFIVCSSQYLSQDLHKLIDIYILACSLFYCDSSRMVWLCCCVACLHVVCTGLRTRVGL